MFGKIIASGRNSMFKLLLSMVCYVYNHTFYQILVLLCY